MKLRLFTITFLFVIGWRFANAQVLSEKLLGVWQIEGDSNKLCLVFINSHSGAVTASDGMLHYNFTYKLSAGQQSVLISELIPIYSKKEDFYQGLIKLENDSTLLLNEKQKVRMLWR